MEVLRGRCDVTLIRYGASKHPTQLLEERRAPLLCTYYLLFLSVFGCVRPAVLACGAAMPFACGL